MIANKQTVAVPGSLYSNSNTFCISMGEETNVYKILIGKPVISKRRWKDYIKIYLIEI